MNPERRESNCLRFTIEENQQFVFQSRNFDIPKIQIKRIIN